MNDDFNTPMALSVLFQLMHEVNKNSTPVLLNTLKYLGSILGLLQSEPQAFLQTGLADDDKIRIDALIAERLQARAEKNWARADGIRAELTQQGIELEDGPQGTNWRRMTE